MIIFVFDLKIHQFFNRSSITVINFNFLIILLHYLELNLLIIVGFLKLILYFFNLTYLILILQHSFPL